MEITSSNAKGSIIISEKVIASIALNAAKDVDGVSSFSNRPVDVVSKIKKGSLNVMSPVKLVQEGEDLTVTIFVNLKPNFKIQNVAKEVQTNVKEAIQNMTSKLVTKVNVVISGVDFEESGDSTEPIETEQ